MVNYIYSYFSESTGFALAAFHEWYATVVKAMATLINNAAIKNKTLIEVL